MKNNSKNQEVTASQIHIPQVSIGMPVYNGKNFIREDLDALNVAAS